ncbi:MAG TPA: universal stress protein [Umezawaea sp.]|jgi:nucleotide-binding universal stress UspA family protein|nr:universal stress protein [Umezawaea sp.]
MKVDDITPIVVGVDGSPSADRALSWAVDEAIIRGCPVHVINAWDYEPLADWAEKSGKTALMRSEALVDSALRAAAVGRLEFPVVIRKSLRGDPSDVLAEAARGNALLVVGSHAGHRVRDLVLGSTSSRCVIHASVPVVVVPGVAVHVAPVPELGHAADHG